MDNRTLEMPFRQRVLESVTGLACSTWSGVAGVEADLRDPRSIGKQQIRARPSDSHGTNCDGIRKQWPARRTNAGASSFRNGHQTDYVRAIEHDFEAFHDEGPQAIDDSGLLGKRSTAGNNLDQLSSKPTFSRPETWHLANDQEEGERVVDHGLSDVASDEATYASAIRSGSRRSAVERLDQVHQHLEHRATSRWPVSQRRWSRDPHEEHLRPASVYEKACPSDTTGMAQPSATFDDEQVSQDFHCPYMDCHRNLSMQNSRILPSEQRRCCVHSYCDFVSRTAQEWVEHVTTPHHNLQVVRAAGEEHESVE